MSEDRSLVFIKHGNLLYIQNTADNAAAPAGVFEILDGELSYDRREFLYGVRAIDPVTGKRRRVEITRKRLYGKDGRGRFYTGFGFLSKCHSMLSDAGYKITYLDWDKQFEKDHPRPDRYQTNWANVERNFEFRPRQVECLKAIENSQHGLVHAITGFGKRIMIVMTCLLYPNAKIHIVIHRVPLVNQMVDELTRYIPNIGQIGGGRKIFGDRITVFTRDSLQHSDFDADLLIVDEAHASMTDEASPVFARYQRSRNFSFTATPVGKSDGSDPRLEALFGPAIFHLPYWEGVQLGLVVPIRVMWRDVILPNNPAAGYESGDINRQRYGIWLNDARNDIIAEDILAVDQGEQWMAITDTIYHAVEIYKRIYGKRERETVLVYDKLDADRFKGYLRSGDIPGNPPKMTAELKETYRKRFEAGDIDVVATKTWEVGIDPIYLQHLFVTGAFGSEIKAQQVPGRASRINRVGKELGIIRDYRDQFDSGFFSAAKKRYAVYNSMKWEQVLDTGNGFTAL